MCSLLEADQANSCQGRPEVRIKGLVAGREVDRGGLEEEGLY